MIAYKGFDKNLSCRGHKFQEGIINKTEEARCVSCGFHCAENPLDCLSYYPDMKNSVYYVVSAGGDIHEDGSDTKLSCTELSLVRKLSIEDFVKHALIFIAKHPNRSYEKFSRVQNKKGEARSDFVIVRGKNPVAAGQKGTVLGLVQEYVDSKEIRAINVILVDGEEILEDTFYNIEGRMVKHGKKQTRKASNTKCHA